MPFVQHTRTQQMTKNFKSSVITDFARPAEKEVVGESRSNN